METRAAGRSRALFIIGWCTTIMIAVGIGVAGVSKFTSAVRWEGLFEAWGYPPMFSKVCGAIEIAGCIGILITRTTRIAIATLVVVMLGALATLILHRGGPLGAGLTPGIYLGLLAVTYALRVTPRSARER